MLITLAAGRLMPQLLQRTKSGIDPQNRRMWAVISGICNENGWSRDVSDIQHKRVKRTQIEPFARLMRQGLIETVPKIE
jgi:hypothetical protein